MVAGKRHDEEGFRNAVKLMRDVEHGMGWILTGLTNERAEAVIDYLVKYFGPDSKLPAPETLPGYAKVKSPDVGNDALNVTYVDWEMPEELRFPFSGAPDGKGSVWIPYYGRINKIGRLDLKTQKIEEFKVPSTTSALIHSAVAAPDGTVWFSEQNNGRVGMYDPRTRKMVEYQEPRYPQLKFTRKHSVRPSADNRYVWASGEPLTRFDRTTKKFTPFLEVPTSYGVDLDKDGNAWFSEMTDGGKIGKVDAKTLKVTKYAPPTNGRPRRIFVAPDGMIWFAEFSAGRLAKFDPKTETFKEYPLPGPAPEEVAPYGLAVDRTGAVWYMSEKNQVLGRLDPNTGKVVEYPTPYAEGFGRELFPDAEGRIWYGLFSRNKVGYFKVPEAGVVAQRAASR